MKDSYPCIWFDGRSSRRYEGHVRLLQDGLRLEYLQNGFPLRKTWSYSDITREEMPGEKGVSLLCGEFPRINLRADAPEFKAAIDSRLDRGKLSRKLYGWFFGQYKRIVLAFGITAGVLAAVYFLALPGIADFIVMKLPEKQEQEWGQLIFRSLRDSLKIDEKGSVTLQQSLDNLKFGDGDIRIYLSGEDQLNAFAVMGGVIVICQPMMELLQTREELAAVLAHEYAHIEKRHSARLMLRQLSGMLILSALTNDYSGATGALLKNADTLKSLQYSRRFEREADERAVELLKERRINPEILADLFLKIEEAAGEDGPAWFSTHPRFDERIRRIRALSS